MNKNFVIVGGTKGIGAAITEKIVQQGNQVFVLSRNPAEDILVGGNHVVWDAEKDKIGPGLLPERVEGLVYCPGTILSLIHI